MNNEDMGSNESLMEQIHFLDYWNIVKKHLNLVVTVFCATVAATMFYIFTATPIYQSSTRILIAKDLSRTVMSSELANNILDDQLRFETELQILGSDPIFSDVLSSLNLTDAPEGSRDYYRVLQGLKGQVQRKRLRNTRLLEITATSASPDTAALLANTVVKVYITKYKNRQVESSRNTSSWLNDQLLDLEYKVSKSQGELLKYISKEKITFVSDGTGLEDELKSDMFKAPDETIQEELHAQLIQATLERDGILQRYKGKHPKVLEAVERVSSLEREYGLEEKRLEQKRTELTKRIIDARKRAVRYDILKRQVDTNKELYNLFIKKMQEVDLSEGLGEGDITVVEAASMPIYPTKPNKKMLLLLGLMLGSALGIGSAFLLEYMDRSLKSKDEIEALIGVPVLSSINIIKGDGRDIDWRNYFSDTSLRMEHELFRVLRANIKFSDLKQKAKIILITSSMPGEGKTTVSTRLAVNMAAAGEKVLLIDADLRKPMIHNFFRVDNKVGLTNLMVSPVVDREFMNFGVIENLDVVTSGPVPAQPAELIENSRFKGLITDLSEKYDRIIIDSPPVGTVIDAAILSEVSDGVLTVLDPKTTNRNMLKHTKAQLEKTGTRLIGCVLNKISEDGKGYYYYSDYYYYGSYGQESDKSSNKAVKKNGKGNIIDNLKKALKD